jgi:hypothetical protein
MPYDPQNIQLSNSRKNKLIFLAAALGAFLITGSILSGAPRAQDVAEPIWPTKEWQTSSPEEQGMDSTELAKLVDLGTTHSLDSLLVVRHGKIVAEVYYAPYGPGIPHAMYSATKAVIRSSRHFNRRVRIVLGASRYGEDRLSVPAQRHLGR